MSTIKYASVDTQTWGLSLLRQGPIVSAVDLFFD